MHLRIPYRGCWNRHRLSSSFSLAFTSLRFNQETLRKCQQLKRHRGGQYHWRQISAFALKEQSSWWSFPLRPTSSIPHFYLLLFLSLPHILFKSSVAVIRFCSWTHIIQPCSHLQTQPPNFRDFFEVPVCGGFGGWPCICIHLCGTPLFFHRLVATKRSRTRLYEITFPLRAPSPCFTPFLFLCSSVYACSWQYHLQRQKLGISPTT